MNWTWLHTVVAILAMGSALWFIFVRSDGASPSDVFLDDLRERIELAELRRAEQERWKPVFLAGCYRYEQHEDGRRRAVRVTSGECDLDTPWLIAGASVPL